MEKVIKQKASVMIIEKRKNNSHGRFSKIVSAFPLSRMKFKNTAYPEFIIKGWAFAYFFIFIFISLA
jgi:hypothetical protein